MNIESEADIKKIVEQDEQMMGTLEIAEKLNLRNWWIGARFLRNKIWDEISGNENCLNTDIDLVYFDTTNIDKATDLKYSRQLNEEHPDMEWQVRNQARMHCYSGFDPFDSTEDAIAHWVETATAIGVKLEMGKVALLFCYGTDDLLGLVARPTPLFSGDKITTFDEHVKMKKWQERWPKLRVIRPTIIENERKAESMELVASIKEYVEFECRKPSSKYGYGPFEHHFVPMVKYAERLCDELGADKEIVSIAAWLHDIGSIIYGRKNHHITGAEIAGDRLLELSYPADKIEKVKQCIINHRGSVEGDPQTLEEIIIAEADAISNFDNIAGIFMAAYVYEDLDQAEAKKSVRKKLQNKYKQLTLEQSKQLVKAKYDAAMLLLG